MRRLTTVTLATAMVAQLVVDASSSQHVVLAGHRSMLRVDARPTRRQTALDALNGLSGDLADVVIRTLETFKLKSFVKRAVAKAPHWIAQLNTRGIRNRTRLVDEHGLTEKLAEAVSLLQAKDQEIGDYLEFGVYNGSSLVCMHRVLESAGCRSRLVGFDSFEGLPPIAATDSNGHWAPGAFSSSLDFTRRVLDYEGVDWSRVTLVKGYFDETLTAQRRDDLELTAAGIIMIDCDLYQSAKEALEFCAPLVVDQTVIFFDDWFPLADRNMGERKAFEEWLEAEATLRAEELFEFQPYGKAFLVTRDQNRAPPPDADEQTG